MKILLPKMNYTKDERIDVIRHAYSGLFKLVSHGLFDKYVDFIDVYAEVSKKEQENLYHEIIQHKETAMLAQYIRDKGMQQVNAGRKLQYIIFCNTDHEKKRDYR